MYQWICNKTAFAFDMYCKKDTVYGRTAVISHYASDDTPNYAEVYVFDASGDTITLSYDEIKRVSGIAAGSRYTKAFDYVTAANGKTGTQISNLRYSGFTNAPTFCYTYTVDGKIASETANGATWNYTYDLQGQLLSASSSSAAYSYTYDAAGNILTANGNTYTYGDGDWADLLTTYNGQSITYDTIGNPTSYYNGTRWTMSWANGRKLMSAASGSTSLSFTYDVSGLRETKTVNNVTHTYSYAGGRLLRETYGNHVLDFAYDTNGAPYTLTYDGTKYYYITNVQGDVMRLIDTNGTKVAEYTYDPFGKVLSASGSMAEINPIRYRGYYYDTETGFYYLQSRYYDPTLCRFINADAFSSTGQGFVGNNMFAYCNNNPISLSDSTGTYAISVFGDVIINTKRRPPVSQLSQRDVTLEVICRLIEAAAIGRVKELVASNGNSSEYTMVDLYMDFYYLVNHNAPWDIKRPDSWKSTIGTSYPGYDVNVTFCGQSMTPEMLGNFTYGYLGHAYGISLPLLYAGSYYAAGFPLTGSKLDNEIWDWKYITMGYLYSKNGYLEGENC